MGRKKHPFYRIVATPASTSRSGQSLAEIGFYDPIGPRIELDTERAMEWLKNGAEMTPTVRSIFASQGVLALMQGGEASVDAAAFTSDKPKRRRKLGAASAPTAEADETTEAAPEETAAEE
jgi:small subunit ribosomal protein S16